MNIDNKTREIEKELSDFISHISYMSPILKNMINEIKPIGEAEIIRWMKKLDDIKKADFVTLSFIIICKNEERTIRECLNGIVSGASNQDEILVIDTGSVDSTKKIVSDHFKQVRLIENTWENDFAKARNKAIMIAKKKWIFFIDADEIIDYKSIANLRKYLWIIEWYNIKDIVISPTIINNNGHVINTVKRILRKDEEIVYFGKVHEEPRKKNGNKFDLLNIAFDNVVIKHDGYKKEVVKLKNKAKRNYELLIQMIEIEPNNPRWKYFLCRDCGEWIKPKLYEQYLLESLELCKSEYEFRRYKICIITDLIKFYLNKNDNEKFDFFLKKLEEIAPQSSNITFFKALRQYNNCLKEIEKLINELLIYRNKKREIEYESLHSRLYHIDFIIAQLLFTIEKYKEAFHIWNWLEMQGYGEVKDQFRILYNELSDFMNES